MEKAKKVKPAKPKGKAGRPKKLTDGQLIYFWVDAETMKKIDDLCFESFRPKSEVCRMAIQQLLEKLGKK